ncbi:hypothetical protein VSDG_08984 [Cytospora chrysosperma]|uniref:DUF7514 domain-containing protein n=1 Tax=Cytospora chrysosperma TaxID=252740 RepID=A0A423VCY2_CYTCH|nr:hypothetical protein VSDG_08984 [Valsa sordida]
MAAATNSNQNSSSNQNTNPVDAKEFYGYLYEPNKTPTKVLDALLRAIGQYITDEIGDKQDRALNPAKLAAFYKAVGGDYDRLFMNAPHESISYIWQVFGCQHTLQPTDNDYEPPTIPALTLRGFVRWESIQVLLSPDEHVPYIIYAVSHWHLKNPDTGETFPADISPEAFPSEPDPEISAWHAACGDRLRQEATTKESAKDSAKEMPKDSPQDSPKPAFPSTADRPNAADRLRAAYSHVPAPGGGPPGPPPTTTYSHVPASGGGSQGPAASAYSHVPASGSGSQGPTPTTRPRPPAGVGSDYFNHRPVPYTHVNAGHAARYPRGATLRVSPERVDRSRRNGSAAEDMAREERSRRRSFSDYPSPQEGVTSSHVGSGARTVPPRRHSHPRGHSSDESDSEGNMSPRSRRSSGHHGTPARGPKVVPRFAHVVPPAPPSPVIPPAVPNAPPAVQIPTIRTEGGAKLRPDDRDSSVGGSRRKSTPFVEGATSWARDKLDKFSTMLPGGGGGGVGGGGGGLPEKPTRRSAGSSGSGGIPIDRLDRIDRMSRDSLPTASHLSRDWSYEDASESESEEERERRRHRRRLRERDRERDRRDRDRDREAYERETRERMSRRSREVPPPADWDEVDRRDRPRSRKDEARYLRRPGNPRRTSSHADVDRYRHEAFDPRDRDRYGDERERERRRRVDDSHRDRDRDRDRERERIPSPVIKGVGGRRYPADPPPWVDD